jgi:hypothetical protein
MAAARGCPPRAARGGRAARRFRLPAGFVAAGLALGAGPAAGENFEPALGRALHALEACLAEAVDLRDLEHRVTALEEAHEEAVDRIGDLCEAGERDEAARMWRAIRPDDWLSHQEAEHVARCLTVVEAQLLVDFPPEAARQAVEASVHVCDGAMM